MKTVILILLTINISAIVSVCSFVRFANFFFGISVPPSLLQSGTPPDKINTKVPLKTDCRIPTEEFLLDPKELCDILLVNYDNVKECIQCE